MYTVIVARLSIILILFQLNHHNSAQHQPHRPTGKTHMKNPTETHMKNPPENPLDLPQSATDLLLQVAADLPP